MLTKLLVYMECSITHPLLCVFQAVFLLIGKTSALTMNIAGVIKDWMLIFFSFYLFKAPVTALNLAGYLFCCSGVSHVIFVRCYGRHICHFSSSIPATPAQPPA